MIIFIDNVTVNVDGSISNMDFLGETEDQNNEKEASLSPEEKEVSDFTEDDLTSMEKDISRVMGVPQDIVHKVIDGLCVYMEAIEEVKREKDY